MRRISSSYAGHYPSEVQTTGHVLQSDDALAMQVYRPKQTTCLRCGNLFDSYDPRYNRRCTACSKSVQGQDDRYNY